MGDVEKHNPHRRRANAPTQNVLNQNALPYIPRPSEDQVEKVSRLRELYHGRFPEDGLAELLNYLEWDEREAARHLQELPSVQEVEHDDPQLKVILRGLRTLQSDGLQDIWQLAKTGNIKCTYRLFACADCNNEWWKRVPLRKQVSKCKLCKIKYDPIPRDLEWGWAIFKCECGNEFGGFGQMGKTESHCYHCQAVVKPTEIKPPHGKDLGPRKTKNKHQCNAPDCQSHHGHDDGFAGGLGRMNLGHGPQRGQGRGRGGQGEHVARGARPGAWNQQCVHPSSRRQNADGTNSGRARVLIGSRRHVSTGSTVDTFLPQNSEAKETVFAPPFGAISEEDEDGDDGSST